MATQVIEISLDISCDIMYTELAPGDALGQRGGRLNRKGRTWASNGFEYQMKIFVPEEFVDEKPRDAPYPISLLKKTNEAIKNGPYSYLELKHLCDYVYSDYELRTPTNLRTVFRKCCLFGFSPYDINFGDEEKGREFELRNRDELKIEVIPYDSYKDDEKKLDIEYQVSIPLWRYKQDEKEYGESRLFMEKFKSGKKKPYLVAKIPYTKEKGFDFKAAPISPPADNVVSF